MNNRIEDQARKIAIPFLEQNNCVLWDVVFEKEGAKHYLKILFDAVDGTLDMDKCEKLTLPLNKLMDSQDFINHVDILEIGSPGITRRLRHKEHFDCSVNKRVRVMRRSDNGKSEVVAGILKGYDGENKSISIETNNNETQTISIISLKKCIRITLEDNLQ